MNKKILLPVLIGVLVLAGAGIWLWSRGNSQNGQPLTSTSPQPSSNASPENQPGVSPSNVKEFTLEASNYKYSLAEMRVKKGDIVRVTIKAIEGGHDFQLDEFAASSRILQAGEQETIQFSADRTGIFEYYCSIGNHRAMGMKGKLIVEE